MRVNWRRCVHVSTDSTPLDRTCHGPVTRPNGYGKVTGEYFMTRPRPRDPRTRKPARVLKPVCITTWNLCSETSPLECCSYSILFCYIPFLTHKMHIFLIFENFCMLFQCLVQLFWVRNFKTSASSITREFTSIFSLMLISVYADFQ